MEAQVDAYGLFHSIKHERRYVLLCRQNSCERRSAQQGGSADPSSGPVARHRGAWCWNARRREVPRHSTRPCGVRRRHCQQSCPERRERNEVEGAVAYEAPCWATPVGEAFQVRCPVGKVRDEQRCAGKQSRCCRRRQFLGRTGGKCLGKASEADRDGCRSDGGHELSSHPCPAAALQHCQPVCSPGCDVHA